MEDFETEVVTPEVITDSETSKTPLLVAGLAVVGAVAVGKKAFNKVRQYKIIRRDADVETVVEPATPAEA